MELLLPKKKIILQLLLPIASAIFFIQPMYCQDGDKPAKVKTVTAKRILYGLASFYHNKFNGRKTANGEIFSQKKLTCACNVLPLGTWIKVTNMRNGHTVVVKTNDRLHPRMKRIIDLTRAAAVQLGYVSSGITRVKVEVLGKKAPKP
jgi:rare lipoprotein A